MNSNIVQVVSAEYVFTLAEHGDYYLEAQSHPKEQGVGVVRLTRPAANPEDVLVFQWTFANWEGEHSVTKFRSEVGGQHKIEFGSKVGGFRFIPNV